MMNSIDLQTSKLKIRIKSLGAEVCSVKNSENIEYIWQGDPSIWSRSAPVLFPIVGKLKDDCYYFKDKEYTLSQHGFARDKPFELIEHTVNTCAFELRSDPETLSNYPFQFIFQILYTVKENILTITYSIKNPSSVPIYFSVGAHPGFRCPLLKEESFEDYFIEFEGSDYTLTELDNGLRKESSQALQLNTKTLNLSKHLFNNDALVFENSQINKVALRSKKSQHGVILDSTNWPYFGIWSKKDCDQFVCLEPWFGIADKKNTSQHLLQKDGIIRLEAKDAFTSSFSITFL